MMTPAFPGGISSHNSIQDSMPIMGAISPIAYFILPFALFLQQFWAFLQAAPSHGIPNALDVPSILTTGGVTAWMFWLYRKDSEARRLSDERREQETAKREQESRDLILARWRESEARYLALAENFRTLVTENTRANERIVTLLEQK